MNGIKKSMLGLSLLTTTSLPLLAQTDNAEKNQPLIFSPQEQTVGPGERILCYNLSANIPYNINVDANWVKIKHGPGNTFYAQVSPNDSQSQRSAEISFQNNDYGITRKMTIRQSPATDKKNDAHLKSFAIGDTQATIEGTSINITLSADDIDFNAVTPTLEIPKGASYSPTGPVNLNQPTTFTIVSADGKAKSSYIVKVNKTYRNKQLIDANRVFFTGSLRNHVQKGVIGEEQNQKKHFDYTYDWDAPSDTLVWGLDVKKPGNLSITPSLELPATQKGSVIEISIDDEKKEMTLLSAYGTTVFSEQATAHFHINKTGRHTVKMAIKSKMANGEVAKAQGIYVSGDAAANLTPILLRWRPSAIHCKWQNSTNPKNIEIAIHEVTIKSDHIGSYSPITTPFGYYGSTWDATLQQFGGVNFSLWSFGAKENPPTVEKFSHLIASGKGLHIDGFNHEGTGVKCRGKNPFDSMRGERTQVLGIMKVPGKTYDTYYSYYWDTNTKEWTLFGCGKKYNSKTITYLNTGAFVEVPGAAEVQRTNHIKREVHFNGWLVDSDRNIYPIDRMVINGNIDPYSYKKWSVAEDGKFVMEMGGFDKQPSKPSVLLNKKVMDIPEYLETENLKSFGQLPVGIQNKKATKITNHSAVLNFEVDKFGTNPTVQVYWGTEDGLTFVEGNRGNGGVIKWQNVQTITPSSTTFSHQIEGLKANTKYYYRLQIVNNEGEIWSWESDTFVTRP